MAYLYCGNGFTMTINGDTYHICPVDTLDQYDLPNPPAARTHKVRVNGNCGSGPYLFSKAEPIFEYNDVGFHRTSEWRILSCGTGYNLFAGYVWPYDWHYVGHAVDSAHVWYAIVKDESHMVGGQWLRRVQTLEVFTQKAWGNLAPTTGAHIIIQDPIGTWSYTFNDWSWKSSFDDAIQLALNAVSDPYNVTSTHTGTLPTGQRFTVTPYGGSSWKALSYYGTETPKVTYEDYSKDTYTFSKLINVGIWDASIKQVCAQAYLDAFEQLPNVTSDGVANIMEAASLLKGVGETAFTGMQDLGQKIVSSAKDMTDPRNDWLTWRYVYNTTKMDIEEYRDVLDRCRNLAKVVRENCDTLTCEGFARDGDYTAIDHVKFSIAETVRPGTMNWANELNEQHSEWAARVSEAPETVRRYLMPDVFGYPSRDTADPIDYNDTYQGLLEGSMGYIMPSSQLSFDDFIYMYDNNLFPFQWKGAATLDWLKNDNLDNIMDALGARLTAANAWDIIPFSFVADWFTNIGNILSTAETWNEASKVAPLEEWMTIVHNHEHGYTFMRVNAGHPSLPPIVKRTKVNDKTIAYRAMDSLSLFT